MSNYPKYKEIKKEVRKMAVEYGMPEHATKDFIKAVEAKFGQDFKYAKWSQVMNFVECNWDGKWSLLVTLRNKLSIMLRALKRGGMVVEYEGLFDPKDADKVKEWLGDVKDLHMGQVVVPVEKVHSKPDCVRLEGRYIYMHQIWALRKKVKELLKNGDKWFQGLDKEGYKAKEKQILSEAVDIFMKGDRWGD